MSSSQKSTGAGYFSIAARAGEIPELDGLRGIAILLVLLRHAARPVYDQYGTLLQIGSWDIAIPLLNGWMGVDLFFVLSGFLITHHLLKHWPETFSMAFAGRYWSKRILRTFPAFYASVLLVGLGLLPFYQPVIAGPGTEMARHFLFLQDYTGSQLVPAFWSLGVEEKFYILCPFVLLWLMRFPQHRQLGILAGLALLPLVLRLITLYANQPGFSGYPEFFWAVRAPAHLALDGLWMGVMCALIYHWRSEPLASGSRLPKYLFGGGCLLFIIIYSSVAWLDGEYYVASTIVLALAPLAFAMVMFATLYSETPISGLLRSRWLRFFAITSYSIYLTHMMVVQPAIQLTKNLIHYETLAPFLQFLLFLPVFLLLSVLAGLLLHLTVEKPFLILKNRVRL